MSGLVAGGAASQSQRREVVDGLFDFSGPALAGVAVMFVSLYGWLLTGGAAFAAWGLSAALVLGFRAWLSARYRYDRADRTEAEWARTFFAAAAVSGLQLGAGAISIGTGSAPETSAVILAVTAGVLAAGGARIYAHPGAAITQAAIASVMVAVAHAQQGRWVEPVIVVLFLAFQVHLVRSLCQIKSRQMVDERERNALLGEMARMAETDALTGLANRRRFDAALRNAWTECGAASLPVSVLLFDVDHFKRFNDTHGHQAGDEVLAAIAASANAGLPADAVLARYGGEEFAVVLPVTGIEDASEIGWRLVRAIRATDISFVADGVQRVTVSLGVATVVPTHPQKPSTVTALADHAMYQAKRSGRDRVAVHPQGEGSPEKAAA
jgi:diguanylate cyclase (GGDEF)-like protein